jgi:hypothetical protein
MLFSPSAYFGGVAAPTAWHLAITADEPLFLQLQDAQEPTLAAYADPSEYQHQGEQSARKQPMTKAATAEFLGWAKGIAADVVANGRVQAVMRSSGVNPQPRLTGPLLARALRQGAAGPGPAGPCGACPRVGYPM